MAVAAISWAPSLLDAHTTLRGVLTSHFGAQRSKVIFMRSPGEWEGTGFVLFFLL